MGVLEKRRTLLFLYGVVAAMSLALLVLMVSPVVSQNSSQGGTGWELERNQLSSYAVIDPAYTNLNVDSIVLACGQSQGRWGLQLELYLSTSGPLLPKGSTMDDLNKVPRAEIVVDGQVFATDILFAGRFVVLVDVYGGDSTLVSDHLLDAMERGRTMIVRFDLLADDGDQAGTFDGEVVIDLQAGLGGTAVAAVRRCGQIELWARGR